MGKEKIVVKLSRTDSVFDHLTEKMGEYRNNMGSIILNKKALEEVFKESTDLPFAEQSSNLSLRYRLNKDNKDRTSIIINSKTGELHGFNGNNFQSNNSGKNFIIKKQ